MVRIRYLLIGLMLGLVIGWLWFDGETRERETSPVTKSVPRPISRSSRDDLTEIEGIGPAYANALYQLGITTFEQLAVQEIDVLAASLPARVTEERIRRERWIEQAKTRVK